MAWYLGSPAGISRPWARIAGGAGNIRAGIGEDMWPLADIRGCRA